MMTSHSHIYLIVKHSVRIRGMCTESKWLYLTYWSAEMSWDLIGRAFNPLIDLIINIFFRYTITNWEKVRWLHSSLPWLFCSFTTISKTCNTRRGYSSICYSVFLPIIFPYTQSQEVLQKISVNQIYQEAYIIVSVAFFRLYIIVPYTGAVGQNIYRLLVLVPSSTCSGDFIPRLD